MPAAVKRSPPGTKIRTRARRLGADARRAQLPVHAIEVFARRGIAPEDGARITLGAGYTIAQTKLFGRDAHSVDRFEDALVRALAGGLVASGPVLAR